MTHVLVLGGYGNLGARCVLELVETTHVGIVAAGRSVQRAERLALGHGGRVRGAYANAADPRTLHGIVEGSACLLACSGADCLGAIEVALEARVPLVVAAPLHMDAHRRRSLAERAWATQVPLVIGAGAVPGLGGVAAERLIRLLPEIETLEIASTGPWDQTPTAESAVRAYRSASGGAREYTDGAWRRARPRGVRIDVPGPLGERTLRPGATSDLDGFPEAHCVRNVVYLEPSTGLFERAMHWVEGTPPPRGFGLLAEATAPDGARARLLLQAADAPSAAAPSLSALVRGILAGRVPAGLTPPREALNPVAHLDALEKRGVSVRLEASEVVA